MVFTMKRGLSCDAWLPYDNPNPNQMNVIFVTKHVETRDIQHK
jgi:hypothetical protein